MRIGRFAQCLVLWSVICLPAFAAENETAGVAALTGAWQCQSQAGSVVLEFRSAGRLVYGGEELQYSLAGSSIRLIEQGVAVDYPYVLRGNNLSIGTPYGEVIACARTGAPPAAAGSRPDAGGQGRYNHLLQGTLCAWSGSSSSTGSYSSTQRVTFDGAGRFGIGSESSFSNTAGLGYGSGDGEGGTYEVTSPQVGAPIRIRWNSGEEDVAYVHFLAGGRITEVKYGKQVFGAPLCN